MLELGIGYIGLTPEIFWTLTPYEFTLCYKGFCKKADNESKAMLIASWYSGYFSQIDLNKMTIKRWSDQLDGIDIAEETEDEALTSWKYYTNHIYKKG